MVFLLTDGQSNVEKEKTIPNAKLLKDFGVEVFVVGVGDFASGINEMVHVASMPPETHLFRVASYGDFVTVVKLAFQEVDPDTYKVDEVSPPLCQ